MTETKHTPGPWEAVGDEVYAERGGSICTVLMAGQGDANARLIAAAPDLLEAAQLLEAAELGRDESCEECGGEGEPEACGKCFPKFDDARIKRRIAIAKATGKP